MLKWSLLDFHPVSAWTQTTYRKLMSAVHGGRVRMDKPKITQTTGILKAAGALALWPSGSRSWDKCLLRGAWAGTSLSSPERGCLKQSSGHRPLSLQIPLHSSYQGSHEPGPLWNSVTCNYRHELVLIFK